MSGGFFRGTSADQDTRFSNKQAKLLKSQKFPAELEHLVDMTKVKMDVIRPWIAARATELLGFEDEVLINFVYGLLDGRAVDGKKIQIQLTGFMEKNTGKFMKELWGLLLSAQNNVSGVPQQFLDAKEEETRKKKVETDRIASEIQKRREREGREPERGRKSRFEGEADISRSVKDAPDLVTRNSKASSSSLQPEEEREGGQHDSRAINGCSRSPKLKDRSPSPYRRTVSPTGSNKRSISRSRSDSGKDHKSRSVSVPSQSQRRSASLERRYQSPTRQSLSPERRNKSPRHSISPRRKYSPRITRSPSRRRSPRLRRRSTSRPRHRSPSPYRQRSPRARQRSSPSVRRRSPISRRRSPSPLQRRSPSPLPRRSPTPVRRRSPSPSRHRSPVRARRKSPSPLRHRSPMRRRSPSPWRRSPIYRSPNHRRRSPPIRSPKRHPTDSQYSRQQRKRSGSPCRSRSPLYQARRSLSIERDRRINGHASRHRDEHTSRRELEKRSHVDHGLDRKITEHDGSGHKASETAYQEVPISLRSPQRDVGNQNEECDKVPAAITEDSPHQLESPVNVRKMTPRTNISLRSPILSKSPSRKTRIRSPLHDSPRTSRDEEQTGHAREDLRHRNNSSHKRNKYLPGELGSKKSYIDDLGPGRYTTDRVITNQSPAARGRPVHLEKNSQRSDVDLPERNVQQVSYSSDDIEYGPVSVRDERDSQGNVHDRHRSGKLHPKDVSSLEERADNEKEAGDGVNAGKIPRPRNEEHREPHQDTESITRSKRKADKRNRHYSKDSDSEETGSDKNQIMEKRRHKKSDKRKRDSDYSSSSDSQVDDRKEAKRRRRDEKRLRKEERRRRREEKHRKRSERRASKEKVKSVDLLNPPSDFEKNHNNTDDSDVAGTRKNIHPSDAEDTESEQNKLEIELRKKALESLRAKKAISH